MSITNFRSIQYLSQGTAIQRAAHKVLSRNQILQKLEPFDPVLVGTIPIDIAIASSDLDIACCFDSKANFIAVLEDHFKDYCDFVLYCKEIDQLPSVIARFSVAGFTVEVFGQSQAVSLQNGYRHMLIENEILQQKGETFKQEIIRLKKQGLKTEPAFAKLLGIQGDPYQGLLDYFDSADLYSE